MEDRCLLARPVVKVDLEEEIDMAGTIRKGGM